MTLRGYSYALLEIIRNAHVVDDERIDLRLLDQFIHWNREEYIKNVSRISGHNELLRQTMWVNMQVESTEHNPLILISSTTIPSFIEGKYGPIIDEIRAENHAIQAFTVVPFGRLRLSGNGKFNSNILFVSVHGKKIYLKSKNEGFKLIEKIKIEGIFSNPMEVLDENGDPQLTPTTGDYPIDGEVFNYVKDKVLKDISFMLKVPSDEINDSTGDIKTN